jgi:hypothetical protein
MNIFRIGQVQAAEEKVRGRCTRQGAPFPRPGIEDRDTSSMQRISETRLLKVKTHSVKDDVTTG